ncbi:TrmB family transcriptional regulator [Candidatus Woesearchaeota archaeon]|nr:TrmB family transcriptional regulator [Candidatus Woesearchaeota archaeon]
MIVSESLLKKLRSAFNLNIYEVKVWTALLSKGSATAGELSDMSNVPRSRSYDVLESLEKKGFIIMKLGRPIKYLAVSPSEIVIRVKKGIHDKAEDEIKGVDEVQKTDVFEELNLLFKQGVTHVDPTTISGSFKGRNNVYDHIINLMANAEQEVLIATTESGIIRKLESMKNTIKKAHANKINIRIAAPLKTDRGRKAAEELKEYAQIKDVDLNSRFVVVDGKHIMFMVNDDKGSNEVSDVGIWVNTPFFAQTLKALFENVWK